MSSALARLAAGLARLTGWLDAMTSRERLMVLGAALAMSIALGSVAGRPLDARLASARTRALVAGARTAAVVAESSALRARLAVDPVAAQREEERRLQVEIADLRAREREMVGALVRPEESARMLRELLDASPELRLVRLETGSPAPHGESGLFAHQIEVEIEGGFSSVVAWLEAVEALPWKLRGRELHYQVLEWPRARVVLRLHTLSIEEVWIRA